MDNNDRQQQRSAASTPLFRYGVAVAAVAGAVLVRRLLDPWLGGYMPLTTVYGAVAVAVLVGGYRPALLAAAAGFLACSFLFVEPRGSVWPHETAQWFGFAAYLLSCGLIIGFGGAMRAARRRDAEQTERLRTTLASIGDGVVTTDTAGRVTNLNAVAEALTGWTNADAVGQPLDVVFRIVNETTRRAVENPAFRALREGVIVGLANHTLLLARDGTERPIDDSAAPIRCKEGEVVGCVLVFRDITERRTAEVGVEAERERFRLAADAVNGIIYECDFATGRVERTRGLYEVLGYQPDEVPPTAAWWFDQIHPDDRERVTRVDPDTVRATNAPVEYRVRHKDGRWLHVEDRAVLVRGEDGRPVRMVGCTVDVTDHRRAERELREKEEQLRLAVGAADMIVWRWDIVTDIVTRLGDTPADAPLGPQYTFRQAMEAIHPDDRPAVRRRVDAALRGDGPELYVSEHRHNETPDGSWRWILVHGRVRRDDQGRPHTMLGLGIDITATKQVEAETRRRETFIGGVLGSITDAFLAVDTDWRVTFANDEILRRHGMKREEYVGGHLWELVPDAVGGEAYVRLHRAMADRVAVEYEVFYEPFQRWFVDKVYPTDDGGLAVYSRDITDRKRAESLRTGQKNVLEMVATGRPLPDVLAAVCRVIEGQEPGLVCTVLLADERERHTGLAVGPSLPDGYVRGLEGLSIDPPYPGYCGETLDKGVAVVVPDERFSPAWRELLTAHGLRSCKSIPVFGSDGTVLGSFAVYRREPGDPAPANEQLVQTAAHLAGIAIERRRAEDRLRQSEERLRLALDSANMGCWEWHVATGELIWAARTRELFGVDADRPVTFDVFVSCLHPDDVGPNRRKTDEALATGEYENEYRVVLPDGGVRWIASRGRVLRDGQHRPARMSGVVTDVTARRQAEEDLKERTAQLNFALASTGVGMWLNTLPLSRLNWDDRTRELFLVPAGVEPTAELFWSRLHPDDREPTRHAIEAAIRDRTLYAIDHRVVNPDTGEVRWVRSSGQATYDAAGTPTRFDGINYDITVQKRQEQELADGQRTLSTLIERCPFGIYIVDADFRIAGMNTGSQDGAFANVRPVIGRPFDEAIRVLWPEDVAAGIIGHFRHTLDTGEAYYSQDFVNPRADIDQTEGYEWELHRLTLAGGRHGVVCYYYDSTRLRQVERELSVEVAAMNRLHELVVRLLRCPDLGTALNEVLDATITLIGADMGNVQLLNPQTGMLDVAAHRGCGPEFLEHFRCVRLDDGTACGRAMKGGERVVIEDVQADAGHVPHLHIARLENWHGVQSTPLMARNGEVLGVLSTHYRTPHRPAERDLRKLDLYARQAADFIERIRTEQALRQLAAELSDANRKKDEFLATLAHELRNPLAPIRNGLQVMKLAGGDVTAVERSRSMMERQVGQMARLIDDLMDLSRISRGKIVLQKTRLRLADVVQDAVDTARPLIEERGHELVLDVPPEPLHVDADRTRLAQVFGNLLNNAAKYTDPGGRIRVAVERRDGDVAVAVEDNGVGIPADMLPRVFEMFTQVDRSLEKSQGGLGIGLNIVKRLVEMHDGGIAAESDGHGRGSRFVVRLRVEQAVPADTPDDDGVRAATPPRRRILVVDDYADGADSLAEMLRIMGNETRTAHDGVEAVAVAGAFRPDVILMDIGMPKLNGYEACRRIRGEPWGRCVVIAAQTGWGQEDDKRKSQEAGFDFHMVKPVDPAALEKMLAELKVTTG